MESNEWKEYRFSELVEIIGGGTPKTNVEKYWNGDIPWLSVKDFNSDNRKIYYTEKTITKEGLKNSSTNLLEEGDLIISARGTVGALAQLGRPMAFNQSCYGLKAKKITSNDFIYYLLKYKIREIKQNIHGSVFDTITRNTFDVLTAKIPNIKEQKAIANILSTLDEKIETNNQINEKLEEMAQALFKHWFVDFEFPNENGEPYKSSGGEMVESELGMIPKGWEVSSLDKIADYLNGLPMQKYRPKEDELSLPVLKIKELRNGEPDINSDRCSANIEDKYIINDGDIIFSWSGTLMIDIWCGGKCGLNQHLFKVTSQKYNKWFYYFWIKRHLDRFINIANSKATTMGHIKRKDLTDSKVLIPTSNVYEKANEILGTIINDIINLKIESKKLKAVRDILLPKLMSGEIRVPLDNNEVDQS
ncbi:restriction endonuclease subunit S [Heyndrickxia coagulans]|uniref:restriction endonuclease subunit S n=1 Tax=Heyndrickxia coagulans TaxID=1398 RepID=UPI002EA75673|nr:restriction endonuclease subunit S [Heyndrickxia coagulans]